MKRIALMLFLGVNYLIAQQVPYNTYKHGQRVITVVDTPYVVFTSSTKNKNYSTKAQATDTSAFMFDFTANTKKPFIKIVNEAGRTIFEFDTSTNVTGGSTSDNSVWTENYNGIAAPGTVGVGIPVLGTNIITGLLSVNNTAATLNANKNSPATQWKHFSWNPTASASQENSWYVHNWSFQTSGTAGGVLAFTNSRPSDPNLYTSLVVDEIGRTLIGYTKSQGSNYFGFYGEDFGQWGIILAAASKVVVGWPENSIAADLYTTASVQPYVTGAGDIGAYNKEYDSLFVQDAKITGTLAVTGTSTLGTIASGAITSSGSLTMNAVVSQRDFIYQTSGSSRWTLRVNSTAESGSNVGSDFNIIARDDAGVSLFTTTNVRSNGAWVFPTTVTVTGNTTMTGDLALNGDDLTSDGDITITPAGGDVLLPSRLTVGGINGDTAWTQYRRTIADTSSAQITGGMFSLSGLEFNMVANGVYHIDAVVIFGNVAATTTGLALGFVGPTASVAAITAHIPNTADGVGGDWQGYLNGAVDSTVSTATPVTSSYFAARVFGAVYNGANAGSFKLTWRPEAAASMTVRQDSWMEARRVR